MQILCEVDCVRHEPDEVVERRIAEEPFNAQSETFLKDVSKGVLANLGEIDNIISEFAPSWPLNQMAIVDRNLLRIAVYEIVMWGATPPKVAVNEAVELAKAFGSESSPKFVNGVLGSVMESITEK
jgi:N utilization substance protein B|tara:strand:- start:649 stop:1026 length:378 start_codon:yes stop_codon:yes gene_type:complete